MGKPNVVTKKYMQDNDRFADVCNFYLFHGKQVIKPEDLKLFVSSRAMCERTP